MITKRSPRKTLQWYLHQAVQGDVMTVKLSGIVLNHKDYVLVNHNTENFLPKPKCPTQNPRLV